MAVISAESVKELRLKTGAGMMDCKRALGEAKGDLQKAVDVLRKQGLAIAAKKAGRTADEGLIGAWVSLNGTKAVLVEVNCETDFVAKNDIFQTFVAQLTQLVATKEPNDVNALLSLPCSDGTVKDLVTASIAKIGENLGVRRLARFSCQNGQCLSQYLHAGSKIGVMVLFNDPAKKLSDATARDVAMHVAAMHPQYVRRNEVPANVIEKEREIQLAQLATTKKPPEILEKIVTGKMERFYGDVCLDEQVYVRDPEGKKTVSAFLKGVDQHIRIEQFIRYQVGG